MPSDSTDMNVERQLSAPMPWIGIYVAASSLICTLAMAADVLYGFRHKRYWFPSKYFTLNAMSLTLLAISVKLPVDLTTRMHTATDRLAKVSSLAFMSTSMANFLTSLGSMSNSDILMNVVALGILVITVIANVLIQVVQLRSFLQDRLVFVEEMLVIGCMLVVLIMFCSSALMLSSTKRHMEAKYHEMHKSVMSEEQVETGRVDTDKLRLLVRRYWVMAETSSPQFVLARSVTCTLSGVLSLLIPFILIEAQIRISWDYHILNMSYSDYKWSTKWILLTQTIGVVVGTIAPAARWFEATRYSSSSKCSDGIRNMFTVEEYWIQKMVEWKQKSINLGVRHVKCRKVLYDIRALVLKLCIVMQSLIVLCSKILLLTSVCIASPFVWCFNYVTMLMTRKCIWDPASGRKLIIYVMLLEGEAKLPIETVKNICQEVDKFIQKGKIRKPEALFEFLTRSCDFNGVMEFDNRSIANLHTQELPYCWSLPIVTLTSIALALPNVKRIRSVILRKVVMEGLWFAKHVDKNLDKKDRLSNIRKAANVVWVGVELNSKWHDKDLDEMSVKGTNSKEVLQELSEDAKTIVLEFVKDGKCCLMRNPLNWPAKVIAANALYRISKTLLLICESELDGADERLFERISVMIADVMAACFTNLPRVITMKCHRTAIEEREKSVAKAALLLGETEDILALLQQRELPNMTPYQWPYIEEWRSFMKEQNKNYQSSSFSPNVDA